MMFVVKRLGDWAIKKQIQSANKDVIKVIWGLCNALETDIKRLEEKEGLKMPNEIKSGIKNLQRRTQRYEKYNNKEVKHVNKIKEKIELLFNQALVLEGETQLHVMLAAANMLIPIPATLELEAR